MHPIVSVIIPTCNRPELFERALRSVLAQTYSDTEVVVVDDGDKVRVRDIVERTFDKRLRYIANEPPRRGGSATRNTGIRASKGEFVAFLDDDDRWLPEKLEIQMKGFLSTDPTVGFSVTSVRNIADEGSRENPIPNGEHDFLPLLLTRFKAFLTSTLVIRRRVFDRVGLFDESFPTHQESDLLLRVAKHYHGLGVNIPLVEMNMRGDRGEHIGKDTSRRILGREMLLEKHADLFAAYPKKLAYHYFQLGLWCRDSGNPKKAEGYFRKAFSLSWSPRHALHWAATFLRVRLFASGSKAR